MLIIYSCSLCYANNIPQLRIFWLSDSRGLDLNWASKINDAGLENEARLQLWCGVSRTIRDCCRQSGISSPRSAAPTTLIGGKAGVKICDVEAVVVLSKSSAKKRWLKKWFKPTLIRSNHAPGKLPPSKQRRSHQRTCLSRNKSRLYCFPVTAAIEISAGFRRKLTNSIN